MFLESVLTALLPAPDCDSSGPCAVFPHSALAAHLIFHLWWKSYFRKNSFVDLVTLSFCFVFHSLNKSFKKVPATFYSRTFRARECPDTLSVQREGTQALLWSSRENQIIRCVCTGWGRGLCLGKGGKKDLCRYIFMVFPSSPEVLWALEMEQTLFFEGNSFLTGTSVVLNLPAFCLSGDLLLDFQIHKWCSDKNQCWYKL